MTEDWGTPRPPKPDPGFSGVGFYIVWNPNGRNPAFRHSCEESAVIEAKRLARMNPGQQFIVLAAVALAEIRDPVVVTRFSSDPTPF